MTPVSERAVANVVVLGAVAVLVVVPGGVVSAAGVREAPLGSPSDQVVTSHWTRHGFAEGWAVAAADVDRDGDDEIFYGGRGLTVAGHRTAAGELPAWSFKWDGIAPDRGGDNEWATGVEAVDATGDGHPDALVTTSRGYTYLVDGVTGRKVWRSGPVPGLSHGPALLDADGDAVPDVFPTGGYHVLSGRTGEPLWEAPIKTRSRLAASGGMDDVPGRGLVVATPAPGAGTNPDSIVPALTATTVYVVSSAGELLYDFAPTSGVQSVGAADVDGDGVDEAVIGTFNGVLYVVGRDGLRWSASVGNSAITALAAADRNGDGRDEIFAGTGAGAGSALYEVVGFSGLGAVLWRHPVAEPVTVLDAAELDGDPRPELLAGAGTVFANRPGGVAVALETGVVEPARQRWLIETGRRVNSFSVARHDGQRLVAIGAADSVLRVVHAASGAERWRFTAGGYVRAVAAGDLDGDGSDDVVRGDDSGHVMAVDDTGRQRWARRLNASNNGAVVAVAVGQADGRPGLEVAAVAERYAADDAGVVEVYDASGTRSWSRVLPGSAQDVAVADLDGNGRPEVIVGDATSGSRDVCTVTAFDGPSGSVLWQRPLVACLVVHLDVGDSDGDGRDEIAVGTQALFSPPHVALLESDGTPRWSASSSESTGWLEIVEQGVVFGGYASRARGHVTLRTADSGARIWRSYLDGPNGGATRYGTAVPDANRDGVRDVVLSSDSGEVLRLDGATGAVHWTTRIEAADVPVTEAHQSGPVAYVGGARPVLVTGQWAIGRDRASTFALALDGTILASFEMEGEAHAAVPVRYAGTRRGAVVGAGLGLYAFRVCPPGPGYCGQR